MIHAKGALVSAKATHNHFIRPLPIDWDHEEVTTKHLQQER
jgi:hypothetical protein